MFFFSKVLAGDIADTAVRGARFFRCAAVDAGCSGYGLTGGSDFQLPSWHCTVPDRVASILFLSFFGYSVFVNYSDFYRLSVFLSIIRFFVGYSGRGDT